MSLTVCLLTYNAGRKLDDALASVADLGAQVIVGDTGSTDDTLSVARARGAEVCAIPWQQDFAAAQNHVLDRATTDWVLWLNPDEVLLPYPREALDALLARPDVIAFGVRVQEIGRADRPDSSTETWLPRLFRRHPALRYEGRLHPHFAAPLEEIAGREKMVIAAADLVVRHRAYLSELTPAKLRWATRLLELELHDRPGQLHYLIEYGRNLLRLDDARGHDALAEAAEQVLAAAGAAAAPTPTVASLLEYLLSVAPQQSHCRLTAAQARDLALRWFPNSPPLLWQMAHNSFQAGDFRDAATLLERAVHLGRTGTYDRAMPFDPALMGASAVMNLGRAYARLGEFDRAEACFAQLLTSPEHQAAAREAAELVRRMRAKKS